MLKQIGGSAGLEKRLEERLFLPLVLLFLAHFGERTGNEPEVVWNVL